MIFSNSSDVYDNIGFEHFKKLLNLLNNIKSIDVNYLLDNYKNKNKNLIDLQNKWIKSLEYKKPDYTVYDCDDYINEAFVCWKLYSRKYLMLLQNYLKCDNCEIVKDDINNVLDLGCGIAYSTVGLYNIFDKANIIGTNVSGSTQFIVDGLATDNFRNRIKIVDENETLKLGSIDMIFASEFFEHLEHPLDLLIDLIDTYEPKYFIVANTFTNMAIGHFTIYYFKNIAYSGRAVSKLFNNLLRSRGYKKVDTGFWNNRPTVWKLNKQYENTLF